MKRNQIQNDPLERMLDAARRVEVPDAGFTQRVMERIEPLSPSRNLYRIPTLATALVSVGLIVWVALSDPLPARWEERWTERWRQPETPRTELRWLPEQWRIHPTEDAETL